MKDNPVRTGNLPAAFTSFVGRQDKVAEIWRLLRSARLLTLIGAGGVGKTRLALEAATVSAKAFPHGAWLVDLTAVREPEAVASTVATALGVPDLGVRPAEEQLAGYLAERRALILLDSCEHLADGCAQLVKILLSAAPELHILATSRRVLGITGEHVLTVPPLCSEDAVALLRDRAAAVRTGFQVNEANRDQAARLCADLDGLPLAIELAASGLRTFTIEQLADRLEDRFAFLTGGSRSAPRHQRTLRGMIEWSYELCSPAERLLWSRLSVFAGGFTLDAAEAVCGGEGIARREVPDLLDRLVAQSVVLTCEMEGMPRYRLLELVRRYGRERLTGSGEEHRLRVWHQDFFLDVAERANRGWYGHGQVKSLAMFRADHTNLLAALEWDSDPQKRLRLVSALSFHWCVGGFLSEGRHRFEQTLAAGSQPTSERAWALLAATWVAQNQGDLTVADRWLDEAERLGEALDDPAVRAMASGFRGVSAHYRGRPEEGIGRYEAALAVMTALGDEREATSWLLALACAQAYAGDPRAPQSSDRLIASSEASGERWGRGQVLMALGHGAWDQGDREAAETMARSALECMRGFHDYAMVARMLELLAWATVAGGAPARAAGLLGSADALWLDAGTSIAAFGPQMAGHHMRCEEAAVEALGRTAYAAAFAEGGLHGAPGRAVDFALAAEESSGADMVIAVSGGALIVGTTDADCLLSRRERQVASLVAKGLSNRQIAAELVLSPRTADRHIENILGKLGFRSRASVAAWWTEKQASAS
ncbi:ATP-binding protein [Streptomyces sp. NPDC050528]|uniref:ATP-binding protein n=1 Tax=Streptomyces sp. NPDC050528 TaxID=3365623 RepID=UPI0037ADF706